MRIDEGQVGQRAQEHAASLDPAVLEALARWPTMSSAAATLRSKFLLREALMRAAGRRRPFTANGEDVRAARCT